MSEAVFDAAPEPSASRTAWAMPLIPVAVSGFLLSAMTSLRVQGALPAPPEGTLAGGVVALYRLFGFEPLFMVCVLTLTWSSIWFLTGRVERPLSRLVRIGALGLSLAILVNLRVDGVLPAGGGELGALLAARLASVVSPAVSIFAVAIVAVAALLLATDFFFYGHFERLGAKRLSARDVGVREPVVDVSEQAELEALALPPTPETDAVAATVASEGPPTPAVRPSDDIEAPALPAAAAAEDTAEEAVDDAFETVEGDVWALEEELSAVTLLGPRTVAADAAAEAVEERAPTDEPVEEAEANLPSEPVTHESTEGPVEDTPLHDGVDLDLEGGDVALDDSAPEDAPDVEVDRGGASGEAPPEDAGAALRGESAPPEEEDDEAVADAFVEPVAEPAAHAEPAEPVPIEPIVELIPQPRAVPSASSPAVDPALVEEAVELVVAYRRASANFLKRRLRVGDDEAMALLRVLAERGVIDCEVGATQGRLRGD